MSLKILAGLELDGAAVAGNACLNELVTGPLGLLEMLETHLGLLAPACSESERVLQYQQCLRECDNGSRFYHRSLELDGPGTAATLLAWRDAWYLHGWDGKGLAGW